MTGDRGGWRRLLSLVGGLIGCVVVFYGCGSSPARELRPEEDESLTSANRMARFAFEKGQYDQAAGIYRKALERAYVRDDAAAILDARYNLALCLMALEQYPEALWLVRQAKASLAVGSEPAPPDLLLLEATILFRDAKTDQALAVTDTILATAGPSDATVLAKTHFLRGLITDARGDLDGLRQAIRAMGSPENDAAQADLAELQGRLSLAEKAWDRAVLYLDAATDGRRKRFDYRRMVITLALSAGACDNAGKPESAAHRYLQAGRSAALQGDQPNARQWLGHALRLADRVGNASITAEAASLLAGLDKALEQAK